MLGRSISTSSVPASDVGIDLVIFDSAITHLPILLCGLKSGMLGVTLSRYVNADGRDAIDEIGYWLQRCAPVRSLHLVSHGRPGALWLGNRWVEAADLLPTNVGTWRNWLTATTTISLYACEVAQDSSVLPQRLAELTGACVVAASRPLGATQPGGHWVLDGKANPVQAGRLVRSGRSMQLGRSLP